jgi:predicted nucleic acid-binding protein
MATQTEAYVDTSAFIAFADQSDTHHALFRRLFADPPSLVTSPLVIAEGHGWFLRRYDRMKALEFMSMLEDMKPLKTLAVGQREQKAAHRILAEFSDQDLTLADAVGLYLLESRKMQSCWSTDFHLGLTGVPLVIHQH